MGLSWAALILLPVLLLLVAGLVAGLVALVANRKTRPWAIAFLGLVAVPMVVLAVLFLSWRVVAVEEVRSHEAQTRLRAQAEQARVRTIEQKWAEAAGLDDAQSLARQPDEHSHPEAMLEPPPAAEPIESEIAGPESFQVPAAEGRVNRMSVLVFSPIVALVGMGLLAGLVYLLVNPKTRWAVLGLMGLMAAFFGVLLVAGLVAGFWMVAADERSAVVQTTAVEEIPPGPVATDWVEIERAAKPVASDGEVAYGEAPDGQSQSKGLLRTVGTALGRAVAAAKKEAADRAVEELKQLADPAAPAEMPVAERPEWVDRQPDRNQQGEFEMPIAVGPYTTRAECREELAASLERAVGDYAAAAIGPQARGAVHLPPAYIQDKIVRQEWDEWKQYEPPLGEMVKLHVLLVFDREAGSRLSEEWNRILVGRRLRAVAGAGAVLLALLSTAWAYLKIDLATGGAHRGRLRFGVAAVLAAVVGFVTAAGAVFLR